MPLLAQHCISSLLFFVLISRSSAEKPEKMALRSIKGAYDSSVGKVFENAATTNFGNKLVNRFLAKLNGKIKDLLNGKELDETMMKRFVAILDLCIENCHSFQVAVTPEAAKVPLVSIITAVKPLKDTVNLLLEKMKNEKKTG